MCGLAGALASNPVDVVRTRMMNQRGGALYQGTLDCILQVSHSPECVFVDHQIEGALHQLRSAYLSLVLLFSL